jgi:hypothetical protein
MQPGLKQDSSAWMKWVSFSKNPTQPVTLHDAMYGVPACGATALWIVSCVVCEHTQLTLDRTA